MRSEVTSKDGRKHRSIEDQRQSSAATADGGSILKFNFAALAPPSPPAPRFRFSGFGKTAAGDGSTGGATTVGRTDGGQSPAQHKRSLVKVTVLAAARRPTCPLSRLPLELVFEVFDWAWQRAMPGPFRPHARPVRLCDVTHFGWGLALAEQNIFASAEQPAVAVLTRAGELVRHMDAEEETQCSGVAVAGDHVFAIDIDADRVLVFRAADGALIRHVDVGVTPHGIAVADGLLLVSHAAERDCVLVFREDGTLVRTIGQRGSGDGELRGSHGMAVHGGELYIADSWNRRVSVFHLDSGAFVRTIGCGETFPRQVCVGGGHVFVTDYGNDCVPVFSMADGSRVADLGGRGVTTCPRGVCVSDDGVLYVACQEGIVSFRVFGEGDAEAPPPLRR